MFDTATLAPSWQELITQEQHKPYWPKLEAFLQDQYQAGKEIFPPKPQVLAALEHTPLEAVKAVILGQDPYHGPGQAHGLCFSVQQGVRVPPSLKNIYKEMQTDLELTPPKHGTLTAWAEQGVLMLNTVLTVEASKAASHQRKGWEHFTDAIIQAVNTQDNPVVFILWGGHAQKKAPHINADKHLIIEGVHPSPLSARNGFFGGQYFSRTNAFLEAKGRAPIQWQLPD